MTQIPGHFLNPLIPLVLSGLLCSCGNPPSDGKILRRSPRTFPEVVAATDLKTAAQNISATLAPSEKITECTLPDTKAHRLNQLELELSLSDILEMPRETVALSLKRLPPDGQYASFRNIASRLNARSDFLTEYRKSLGELVNTWSLSRPTCSTVEVNSGAACFSAVAGTLARRAWRHSPSVEDADRLKTIAIAQLTANEGSSDHLQSAVLAILLSPRFIFREFGTSIGSEQELTKDFELAARMSFALWRRGPDDELLKVAESGKLRDDTTFKAQIDRLLGDPRSEIFVQDLAEQWLELNTFDAKYAALSGRPTGEKEAIRSEPVAIVRQALKMNLPISALLTSPQGDASGNGLLGLRYFHIATAHGNQTSVVARGTYVMGRYLCMPPPPPPPAELATTLAMFNEKTAAKKPLRDRMLSHRTNPACASCHAIMDELGFPLEVFDTEGRLRTLANGFPIDAVGQYPGGIKVNGPTELASAITSDPRFPACAATKISMQMVGSILNLPAGCGHSIVKDLSASEGLKNLIIRILSSKDFQL